MVRLPLLFMLRDSSLIPLSHQHHNGLALCVLTTKALANGGDVTTLAQRIIDRYEIELINHFEIEEQVLFPLCTATALVARLKQEHRALEGLVERLRVAPSKELLEEFCELLSRHIRVEERELFEEAQRTIARDVLDQIGTEIDRRAVRVCL